MNRKWAIGIAVAAAFFVAAYLGSPFWAARQFRDAAFSADIDRLDATVDFPAVRDSLKSQMTVAMTDRMQNDPSMRNNPFAGLGMLMMPAIIGKLVDGFVTPEGLSAILKRGKPGRDKAAATEPAAKVRYRYAYRSLDRFAVAVEPAGTTDKQDAPQFVFERRGLFSWKLIRLEIPPAVFADKGV